MTPVRRAIRHSLFLIAAASLLASCGGGSQPAATDSRDQPQAVATAPVYRFAKISNGAYFFTGDANEKAFILQSVPDMRYEGIGFTRTLDGAGTPVYRFANLANGGYFYTANPAERDLVIASRPDMRYEGSSFSVAGGPTDIAVTRLANLRNGAYLFTTNAAEVAAAVGTGFWRNEGLAFYAPGALPALGERRMSAGDITLAIRADYSVAAWDARNSSPLAGNGPLLTEFIRAVPVSAAAVAAGADHSLALGIDGNVYAWGKNFYRLPGTNNFYLQPRTLSAEGSATAVYASLVSDSQASYWLRADGSAWYLPGEIRLHPDGNVSVNPAQVPGLSGLVAFIGEDDGGVLARRADGSVVSFEVAKGSLTPTSSTPVKNYAISVRARPELAGLLDYGCYGSGSGIKCLGLKANGKVYTWGQAGPGTAVEMPFAGGPAKQILAAGGAYFVRTEDKRLWSWGTALLNGHGQFVDLAAPTPVASLAGVEEFVGRTLCCTAYRFFVRLTDGSVYGWGTHPELGGPAPSRNPTKLPGLSLN